MYNNILVPIDFSDESTNAVKEAIKFLNENGKITVFHVIPNDLPVYLASFEDMTLFGDASEIETKLIEIREEAEEKLSDMVSQFSKEGINIDAEIVEGKPYVEIIKKSKDFDLIVLGLKEKNYGISVSPMKVVRKAESDVLIIKGTTDVKTEKILFGVDINEVSSEILEKIKFFSQKEGLELFIIYVIEIMPFWENEYLSKKSILDFDKLRETTIKTLKEKIGVEKAQYIVSIGIDIAEEINTFAKSNNIDLVFMGHKKQSGFERTILGSTSEKFVHISKIPTLIIK